MRRGVRVAIAAAITIAASLLSLSLASSAPTTPIDLSSSGRDAGFPQISVGPGGTAHVAWQQRSSGGTYVVQYASVNAAGVPTAPLDLSAPGVDATHPQVALSADGIARLVWTRTVVQYASISAGIATAPIDVSVPGEFASNPQVALSADGTAHIVWFRFNGSRDIVQYATVNAAGHASAPIDVSAPGQNAQSPQVAAGPGGTAHATWRRWDGNNDIVQYATVNAAGVAGAPIDLSAPGQNALAPQIVTGPDGTSHVTWHRSNGANTIVQYASVSAAGIATAPIDLSAPGQNADQPQVAVGSDGLVHVIWRRSNGTNNIIQHASVNSAGIATAPIDLSAPGQHASSPQVAVSADGTAHVSWSRSNGVNGIAQYAAVTAAGIASSPVDLTGPGPDLDASGPQVAVDTDGSAHLAWDRYDGTATIVQYSAMLAAPTCTGSSPSTDMGTAVTITLDCSGRINSRSIIDPPGHGTVGAIDQNARTVTYTPTTGYVGSDSFTFAAANVTRASGAATVTITIRALRKPCTVTRFVGCSGADHLYGSGRADRMYGRGGADRMHGRGGADRMYGGTGNDDMFGDDGNDSMFGGQGRDQLRGGRGNDKLDLGPDRGTMRGGPGRDVMVGSSGPDLIFADFGVDVVRALAGNDRIDSRDGYRDVVNCGDGADRVRADPGDTLIGCEGSW